MKSMTKATGLSPLCCVIITVACVGCSEAFLSTHTSLKFNSAAAAFASTSGARRASILAGEKRKDEADVSVFDAGDSPFSWEDYKKTPKPDEFKLDNTDEMQCWNTDECPVEDQKKYTKAWQIHSAERNPTMETHFDSEGEWEEESTWARKWHEDVGEDDLREEIASPVSKDGFGI